MKEREEELVRKGFEDFISNIIISGTEVLTEPTGHVYILNHQIPDRYRSNDYMFEGMNDELYQLFKEYELEIQSLNNKIISLELEGAKQEQKLQLIIESIEKLEKRETIGEEFDPFEEFGINNLSEKQLAESLKKPPKRPKVPTIFDEE